MSWVLQGQGGKLGSPSSLCATEQVQAFDKKLEDMSNQVLQWQKQHQRDLEVLAAKEEQLRAFREEMRTLKESLLADGTEVGTPQLPAASSHCPRTSHDRLRDRHPLVGVGVPGSKERTPPLFSIQIKLQDFPEYSVYWLEMHLHSCSLVSSVIIRRFA